MLTMRAYFDERLPEWKGLWPGVLTSITIAMAAVFVSEHQGGPRLLYALFFGMAFNFCSAGPMVKPGFDFASRHILRFGVALTGVRITLEQIGSIGPVSMGMVIGAMLLTILFGVVFGRLLRRPLVEGVLTGGAVAICGASAALAISAVLPRNEENQRFTLFTVVGVTTLSTVAMITYPALAKFFGLEPNAIAVFLGGTIHDVAQVVAAGNMISPQVGDAATFVKLLRVAMLLPIVVVLSLIFRKAGGGQGSKPPLLPGFLVGFAVLVAVNSMGWIPQVLVQGATSLSSWCLVVSIAALGVKTSFQQLATLGWRPVIMLVVDTLFLAGLILGGLLLMR